MAAREKPPLFRRFGRTSQRDAQDYQRVQDRYATVSAAVNQWLSLLREMEHSGQSSGARYESYFQAYLRAKEDLKRIDLELFNLRQGLSH